MNTHDVRADLITQIAAVGEFLVMNCESLTADIEENYLEMDGLTVEVNIGRPGELPTVSVGKTFAVPVPSAGRDIQL